MADGGWRMMVDLISKKAGNGGAEERRISTR